MIPNDIIHRIKIYEPELLNAPMEGFEWDNDESILSYSSGEFKGQYFLPPCRHSTERVDNKIFDICPITGERVRLYHNPNIVVFKLPKIGLFKRRRRQTTRAHHQRNHLGDYSYGDGYGVGSIY